MRLLVKIGGAQLETGPGRAAFARAVAQTRAAGHELIVVHGGGNQIRALGRRLGLEERYHEGLRITDADTAEVVLMVLGGSVNRRVVWALEQAGVRAVGLSGADGSSFLATPHRPGGRDLGFVGKLERVRPELVELLLGGGYVPVLATTAPAPGPTGDDAPFYNVNADMAAGPLGNALGADVLLFLTDVPGVLDGGGALLRELSPADCETLIASGVIAGGMRPKIDAALAALRAAPDTTVKIAPAAGEGAIVAALDPAVGTAFARQETTHG
jgi:acetylglutamate kinase